MPDPRLRQITIKTGVVKRLIKEEVVNHKEIAQEENRLKKFKSEGADSHVLKKQEEVIQECMMMVPDSERRLKKALEELEEYLKNEDELKEEKEYIAAQQVLDEIQNGKKE